MHLPARHRRRSGEAAGATNGLILTGGWRYDLHEWFFDTCMFRSKGRELRRRAVTLAYLQPGEQVLDVGCGTGSLALDAWRRVGSAGRVVGIDPGSEQIARAQAKAARRRAPIEFQIGAIERLDFPDQTFDAVFSTLMMHHLPAKLKRQGLAEIARVLKSGGRLVIADFTRKQERSGRAARFHAGGSRLEDLVALAADAGFVRVETEHMEPPQFSMFPGAGVVWAYKDGDGTEPSAVAQMAKRAIADSGVHEDQGRHEVAHDEATASRLKRLIAPLAIAFAIVFAVGLHVVGGVALVQVGFAGFSLHDPPAYVVLGLLGVAAFFKLRYLRDVVRRRQR